MANKKTGKVVMAWELGTGSKKERQLLAEKKIVQTGKYTLFSQNGTGQNAVAGDFFKVDNAGYPYPIKRECFLKNHWPITDLEPDTWEPLD